MSKASWLEASCPWLQVGRLKVEGGQAGCRKVMNEEDEKLCLRETRFTASLCTGRFILFAQLVLLPLSQCPQVARAFAMVMIGFCGLL